jgi:GntR family transcriptional regulator
MNIKVNSTLMIPIYEQIVDQIKTLIRIGKLEENDMLPSVRSLSKELKISALTVKKAYDYLESEGFVVLPAVTVYVLPFLMSDEYTIADA